AVGAALRRLVACALAHVDQRARVEVDVGRGLEDDHAARAARAAAAEVRAVDRLAALAGAAVGVDECGRLERDRAERLDQDAAAAAATAAAARVTDRVGAIGMEAEVVPIADVVVRREAVVLAPDAAVVPLDARRTGSAALPADQARQLAARA